MLNNHRVLAVDIVACVGTKGPPSPLPCPGEDDDDGHDGHDDGYDGHDDGHDVDDGNGPLPSLMVIIMVVIVTMIATMILISSI